MGRRNRGNDDGGSTSEWLNTYADMVTLLLTFFAVLLSMSTVNQEKFNAFIKSFSNLPPEQIEEIIAAGTNEEVVEDPESLTPEEISNAMNNLYELLSEYVKSNGMESSVSVYKIDDSVFIRFASSVFFEPDKYIIRDNGYEVLSFIGDGLKEYEEMIKYIAICGHTADIGDTPNHPVNNWMLSGERAAVVGMYFDDVKSIDPHKIRLLGYGKNLPIAENSTEEGRKKNRRVELFIISKNSNFTFDPYDPYEGLGKYLIEDSDSSNTSATSSNSDTQGDSSPDGVQKGVSPYD